MSINWNSNKKHIFVSIPAYTSNVFVYTMFSIFNNVRMLEKAGYKITFHAQLGCCYLDQTRNHIVREFLEKTDAEYLIMVDSDLAFDFDAMAKMIKADVPVVGGAYPYRSYEKEGFPISIKLNEEGIPIGDRQKGLIECKFIPTGLMVTKRSVFKTLSEKYQDLHDGAGEFQFFSTGTLFKSEGNYDYYGEDVYFSEICNRAGIKVYVKPDIGFVHIGELHKRGNYDEYLRTIGTGAGKLNQEVKEYGNSKRHN